MHNITVWIEQGWLNLLVEPIINLRSSRTAEDHTTPCFRKLVNNLSLQQGKSARSLHC